MNPRLSLILEIQSGLIHGVLASEAAAGSQPVIVHSVSLPIPGAGRIDSASLISNMSKTLSQVLEHVAKSVPLHQVARVECILSSPWIVSRTQSLKIAHEKETTVTAKMIGAAISRERKRMAGQIEGQHGQKEQEGLTWIEQKIFEIKINGYPVADFQGKKARELEVFFAVSMSPDKVIAKIAEAVGRHVGAGISKIAYHSSVLLGYAVSREDSRDEAGYIVVHVHGELSDIAVVRRGVTTLVGSFPFGYSALVREVSSRIGEPELIARSKITLHSSKSLHGNEAARVGKSIDAVIGEKWTEQFMRTVLPGNAGKAGNAGNDPLPGRVLLIIPVEYYPHFKKALESEKPGILDRVHTFIVSHVNTNLIHTLLRM